MQETPLSLWTVKNFPYNKHITHPICSKPKNKHKRYINIDCAFDIETTTHSCTSQDTCRKFLSGNCPRQECPHWVNPLSYMYVWQFCIHDDICIGRTWEELEEFLSTLRTKMELDKRKKLVVYVHNLPFEFQFLKSIFPMTDVFARQERQPIKATMLDVFEFRCSYKLSNMSLEKFCKNTPGVIHKKAVGNLDYDIIRTPSTPLTDAEITYIAHDVIGLCECIRARMGEYNLAEIPLTSTGYVRNDCRKAFHRNRKNRTNFRRKALTVPQYKLARACLRGGDTHANSELAGEIWSDVSSYDIKSSYPYVLMTEMFPGKFIEASPRNLNKYKYPEYSFMGYFRFTNIYCTSECNNPYIDVAHCKIKRNYTNDNGRILAAEEIQIPLTNVDYEIIKQTYHYDTCECKDFYVAKNEYLEPEIRETIMEYFRQKTILDGIEEMKYEYLKSKNRLNAIYGMMVTDILQDEVIYKNGAWSSSPITDYESAIEKYYSNQNSFLSYQVGVWTTAYARRNLRRMLETVGGDVLYGDTDSIKYIGDHTAEFEAENARILETIRKAPIPPQLKHNGKWVRMGMWEEESPYSAFITWGSKRYAFIKKGKDYIETTVSGLSKDAGIEYFKRHPLSDFRPGVCIYPSGRLSASYCDTPIGELTVNGETFTAGTYVSLIPTTYCMGITDEYTEILGLTYYDIHDKIKV